MDALSGRGVEGRKTVTILFCDLVAYTELAERLDPEALRVLMLRFFERAAAVIGGHGGTVEKFVGDEVMAVFGVPAVHEDDALRAVRAAGCRRERRSAQGLARRRRKRHVSRAPRRWVAGTGHGSPRGRALLEALGG